MSQTNDGYYEALWPRSARQVERMPLAKRLDTLEGNTGGPISEQARHNEKSGAAPNAAIT